MALRGVSNAATAAIRGTSREHPAVVVRHRVFHWSGLSRPSMGDQRADRAMARASCGSWTLMVVPLAPGALVARAAQVHAVLAMPAGDDTALLILDPGTSLGEGSWDHCRDKPVSPGVALGHQR